MPSGFLNFRNVPLALRKGSVPMKAISFGLVGVVNSLVDFGVFWIALRVIALPLLLANLLAWLAAVSGSYVLNCFTTFAAESGRKLALRKIHGFHRIRHRWVFGRYCHARYCVDVRSHFSCEADCDRRQLRFQFFAVALCDFPPRQQVASPLGLSNDVRGGCDGLEGYSDVSSPQGMRQNDS